MFLSGHDRRESSPSSCQKLPKTGAYPAKIMRVEGEFVPSSHGIKKQRGRLVEKIASELG